METNLGRWAGRARYRILPFLLPLFVSIAFLPCILGCRQNKSDQISFEASYDLKGVRMNVDSHHFVYPNRMHRIDSFLLVEDSDKYKHFRVINTRSLEVSAVGKMGNGPGELTFPTSIQILPGGSHIGLCIRPKFVFGEFTLKNLLQDSLDGFEINRRFDTRLQKVAKVNDSTFVGIGLFRKRYAVFDEKLTLISEQHSYPFQEKLAGAGLEAIGMAYQGDIAVTPNGNRIVVIAEDAIHFQILDVDGYNLVPVETVSLTYPLFSPAGGNVIAALFSNENIHGFLDVSVTGESVYLLFSGETTKKNPQAQSAARTVFLYSWNGKPICQLNLDRNVACIAADEEENVLYAIEFGKEPHLVYFPLPEINK